MLRLYNTLTRQKEAFEPLEAGVVRMYNCGPTVYDFATIGNFRSFLFADLLRRVLDRKGFSVTQVMNITDVGHLTDDADEGKDKIQEKALREKVDPYEITRRYEAAFHADAAELRILRAHHYPRATEHVPEIITLIEQLVEKGLAYVVDGEVYYDIAFFPTYGRLSGNRPDELKAGARVAVNDRKRHPADFALWKSDPKHLMQWDSPWGRGFPGWHVECSAMSAKYLGKTLDIHTGGEDNIFPHHECEIAQSEGAWGKPFVRYWLHARFLMVNGEKMSKSRGNFFTIRDLQAKGFTGRTIRYALMTTHYRQHLNFTLEGLSAAQAALGRIDNFVRNLRETTGAVGSAEIKKLAAATRTRFDEALDDDLNISSALAALFDLIREANKVPLQQPDAETILPMLDDFDRVLGFLDLQEAQEEAPTEVHELLERREAARRAGDYAGADKQRDAIQEKGWSVEDTPEGPRLRKMSPAGE